MRFAVSQGTCCVIQRCKGSSTRVDSRMFEQVVVYRTQFRGSCTRDEKGDVRPRLEYAQERVVGFRGAINYANN